MEFPFSPRGRAERLIAAGRVVLAASSLLAVWRDPSEPAKYASIAYALLTAYLVYATIVALLAYRRGSFGSRSGLLAHVFDLAFFSAFMYFTSGPASPFIAYFVFSLVCATLRWQWRGTFWTAIASLGAFLGFGYYFAEVLEDPGFELNEFLIRGVYMGVVALLLGHLGRHEQRTREEMSRLAAWPGKPEGELERTVERVLENVARVHGASHVAVLWRARGGTTYRSALRAGSSTRFDVIPATETTGPAPAEASFLAGTIAGSSRAHLLHVGDGLQPSQVEPLAEELRALLGEGAILGAPWSGELSEGRLFVAGLEDPTSDDLILAEIVASLAGSQLDGHLALERRRADAASEERMRLARDLHDGYLQSLTGFGLRVAAARRLLDDASAEEARRALEDLQRALLVEQRDLRFFIQDLEPPPDGHREFDLAPRLAELVRRAEQEWQLVVELHSDLPDEGLGDADERDLYFLAREALVNAVRHGNARRVRVTLTRPEPHRARLVVEDDGCGFPFSGRLETAQLTASGVGPRSLRERLVDRGGSLAVESGANGARVEMELPL